ncbi:DUF4065 domain-containing protein [Coprococcus comes]|jgi:uncharacterized phage-associated protein|uniref:DUF4065 domain-containing protein n=1 Tax=Coprococcus comes TaxID=410072 RepID=A0A412QC15_9FIRM|nr:type II toxin-antitoxin system antitoxin SocA domain-containing protein [Coprococcus comes]RGT88478.1 DUF4065 domain-containing protein [Coprococcus comes]DAL01233.1 MAG TPA: hypothetical protein [Caudoviricetes sp.]DAZ74579.1 MAG TPA: hypothetical protein [Caudoviricetes sp.]
MYSAIDVAKYIILFCKENGYSISNLKLQKLLYFVQAQFLITTGKPAFSEEIEAWDFGPVVPEVYQHFKMWGSSELPSVLARNAEKKIYKRDQENMNEILEECAQYSASFLVDITHNQDPWADAYEKYCNNVITKESIKEYFRNN